MTRLRMVSLSLAVLALAALLWGIGGIVHADPGILYVDGAGGSNTTDCTNPAAPCATIGYALTQATNGDEIRIARGTYTETLDIAITLTLKGGYEATGWTRDIAARPTIVDANGADDSVLTIGPGNVMTVEGLTIQGANHTSDWGGGIYLNGATVVISGTLVRDNSAGGSGGGIYVENTVSAQNMQASLINCRFTANTAGGVAGLQMQGGASIHVFVKNTAFTENNGGAVLGLGSQTFEVVGGQVSSNTVTGDVAIYIGGSGTISGTEIASNTSRALHIWPGNAVAAHKLTVRNNTQGGIVNQGVLTLTDSLVENNSGGDRSLITSENEADPDSTRLVIRGSTIRGNNDTPGIVGFNTGYGELRDSQVLGNDDVAVNGDIVDARAQVVRLVNVLLAENQSTRPVVNGNTPTGTISLMNVTVAGNDVTNTPVLAGEGAWVVTNTIVWGNTAPGEMIGLGTFSITYSDIEGGWTGATNISADPKFADAASGDYRLQVGSPCVDSGTATGAPDHDLEGTARPQNLGYDMGTYELVTYRVHLPLVMR